MCEQYAGLTGIVNCMSGLLLNAFRNLAHPQGKLRLWHKFGKLWITCSLAAIKKCVVNI